MDQLHFEHGPPACSAHRVPEILWCASLPHGPSRTTKHEYARGAHPVETHLRFSSKSSIDARAKPMHLMALTAAARSKPESSPSDGLDALVAGRLASQASRSRVRRVGGFHLCCNLVASLSQPRRQPLPTKAYYQHHQAAPCNACVLERCVPPLFSF